jgi:acyl-CoA synthetase
LRTVPTDLAARYRAEGFWSDATLGQVLSDGLAKHGSLAFVARSEIHPWSGTLAEVLDLARRVAGTLGAWGVGPGDVVAFQLPNWVEAAATFYATTMLGAVVAPIVHFYGAREVGHILRQSEARVLVTCDHFGHVDHLGTLEELRPNLPALEHVAVVSSGDRLAPDWAVPFRTLSEGEPLSEPVVVDPAAPALVAYTSGTTSTPKGVVHSHRTIGAEIRQLGGVQPGESRPTLYGAPVGHGIGMLGALLLPVYRGVPIHMIDVWDPTRVLAAMASEGLTSGTGATFFLTSLLDHPDFGPEHLALMSHIGLGGSAVPRAVGERATRLGISIVRLYGSTEHPSITGCEHEEPLEKRLSTDGRLLPGCEMRIVDDDDRDLPPGEAGEIWSRGPDCFMGYTDPDLTAEVFDADGWYRTEDVGVADPDGYLAITDRRKDIIIRGGENVSAAEIEELLLHLPGVAEVAVVAAPDARLGEHACAVLRMLPHTAAPGLPAVQAHLHRAGLARQKWPEELRAVDDFPRTASGKVQKFVLRERLRTGW